MLGVQILENHSMAVQVIELGEYLVGYLGDTRLRKGLTELCQTVKIFFSLLNKWTHNKERVIWVKGVKIWFYDGRIEFWKSADLGLHLINTFVAGGYFDALDKFCNCTRANAVQALPLTQIALVKTTIAIEY